MIFRIIYISAEIILHLFYFFMIQYFIQKRLYFSKWKLHECATFQSRKYHEDIAYERDCKKHVRRVPHLLNLSPSWSHSEHLDSKRKSNEDQRRGFPSFPSTIEKFSRIPFERISHERWRFFFLTFTRRLSRGKTAKRWAVLAHIARTDDDPPC